MLFFLQQFLPVLNKNFFGGKLSWEYFLVSFSGVLFIRSLVKVRKSWRLLFRPWSYIFVVLSQSLLAAAIALILILKFNQGILGFFWGGLVAALLVAAIGWFKVRSYLRFDKLHFDLLANAIKVWTSSCSSKFGNVFYEHLGQMVHSALSWRG